MRKFLIDFFPLLAFFVAYKLYDIYTATAVLMGASALQVIGNYALTRKWEKMHLYVLGFALVFGGLTLWLHDDRFIKWKVTIFYWLVAAFFLFRQLVQKKIVLKQLLESLSQEQFPIPDTVWARINLVWALTALVAGVINLHIAFSYSQEAWVNFKVWGITGIQLLLMIYTGFAMYKYLPQDSDSPRTETATDSAAETADKDQSGT